MPGVQESADSKRKLPRAAFNAVILGVALIGAISNWSFVARAASVRAFVVAGGSMSPTFAQGDRIAIELTDDPRPARGDIWVFHFPERAANFGTVGIKRVVGLPGDEVEVKGGRLVVNDQAIEEPYLDKPMSYVVPPTRLGPDEYYVLGDDRDASSDSHSWGVLPRDHFVGKVNYRVWPLSKLGEVE